MANAAAPQVNWRDLLTFLSPKGQEQIAAFIAEARATRGEHWLEEIQAEFPTASWFVDLAVNYTADDALDAIATAYPHWPVKAFAGDGIRLLHARLNYELEKPR